MEATPVQVNLSDVLGTAMTAARVGATRLEGVREGCGPRADAVKAVAEAVEQIAQALSEAIYVQQRLVYDKTLPGDDLGAWRATSHDATDCDEPISAIRSEVEHVIENQF